ncbi:disease resistance protein [Actinidia rufa]|uniref:Disease resistance protein n=1 Tax=Actinidia rufa TaxID=165716 RepID=A0A7J0F7I8_9ERIC|nr:disease resistance protein [Actinidia rufa]
MAIVRAQDALSFTPQCNYHVFLSFRGEDTRKTFTDHLYAALSGAGLRTFIDDEGIERGESVNLELEKAIKAAKISIIVFSKNYASSRWCLDELVMILEHKRTSGHVILPVFYDVVPSQVRHQTGSFAEAFGRHEELFRIEIDERKREYLKNKVEGWREALREVANLAGMDLRNDANGHEAKFIHKIVKVIGAKLNRKVLHVAPYMIGMEYRVGDINSWLWNTSADVGIAVICGMGGIERPNGLVRLQRQLLSDILKGKEEHINSVDEGIVKIKEYIGCKRVLVVLDDVDSRDLFDKTIGMRHWFHPGSKIVLTTRNKHLLKAHEVCRIFEVEKLREWESLALFSWHAFKQDHPVEGYVEQSKEVARRCEGLPLALEILGSSLSGKTLDIWESALQKLAAIPDSQIMGKLRISYDSLQDDNTRRLFLYIACFFFGEDKDFTVTILDGCFKDFPKRLTWLSWHRFSLKSIPSDFPMESLVALDLSHSKLEHVWKGTKLLKSLKILNLSHCHGLTNTPNFTVFPNLEDLTLEDCVHLVKVHESIGELKKIVSLNMKGCKNLKKLPSEIQCLTSLRTLNMSGCSKLDLSADGIMINRTGTTHGVESGSWLFKPFVLKPRKNPESLYFSLATLPRSLVTLSLAQCNVSSDGLARSLGSLSLLQDLNLSMNPISSLPESIKYLTMLKSLKLDSCKRLQSLPELPNSLTMLNAGYCSSLQMVSSPPNLFTSLELDMSGCEKLVEVQGIFTLMPIGNVNPEIIKNLALDLVKLESMGNLNLKFFNHMTRVINNGQVQRTGSVLLFNVPSHANHKIQALNVYILYAYAGDKDPPYWKYIFPEMDSFDSPSSSTFFDYYRQLFGHGCVEIGNMSKDLIWRYWPACKCVPDFDQDWLWSSHWKNGHQVIIEGGDHIVVVAEETKDFMVKEVGVEIVWDEDLENGRQHHTNVDLSPYLDRPGRYFLNHYYPYPYQVYYEKLQGNATTEVESHLYSITRSMLEPYFSATTTI